jgi:hypothetical protein
LVVVPNDGAPNNRLQQTPLRAAGEPERSAAFE